MDRKLLAWGLRGASIFPPRIWLFTDEHRLADPRASVASLPRGRAGVVLRHDHDPERAVLGRDLARICRMRRLILVVAGDVRLADELRAGVHLRNGRWPGALRHKGVMTSSAHSVPDLRRAWAAGACLVFLSPAFATLSHAGSPGLGPLRWAAMARMANAKARATGTRCTATWGDAAWTTGRGAAQAPALQVARKSGGNIAIAALGGVDGQTVNRLPAQLLSAVGAIGALASDRAQAGSMRHDYRNLGGPSSGA